ncbi:UDP-3-O-acyl-N-acetylglucosamine deacetylase [Pseudooceanicola sp. LIPI14-2-Ac024]|uniref:UDP-3-O-acyl-N-acetylglucosamine deacetylase n=1 Tax=Pseudooceanicola sp. LIPI14-2-Ac024 TaxID=3344875 RepID=UPI0035D06039
MQNTLKSAVTFAGIALHSGRKVKLVVRPAAPNHGIWFRRTDIQLGDTMIPALWDSVTDTTLCTRLENAAGVTVSTVEHLMAALAGCGIHNALVEIDGPEVPILDGSSAPFVRAFLARGVQAQAVPVRALEILRPVEITVGNAKARLEPASRPEIAFRIEFDDAAIGTQEKSLVMSNGSFVRDLCDSRTFCRNADVEAMRARGLALGGTTENAVVVDGDRILTPGGLRHADEPVRHKMLDALGDLALTGAPILGRYVGLRAGHGVTNRLLHALFADPTAYRMVTCDARLDALLPGSGISRVEIPAVA